MHVMKKVQDTIKITILFYSILLLLPLSFYLGHNSFDTINKDTKIVKKTAWISSMIEYIALNPESKETHQIILKVDQTFQDVSAWVTQNENSDLYIGTQTLSKDFSDVNTCWKNYKVTINQSDHERIRQHALKCWELANNIATIIEKMSYLKQSKMINMFYFSLAVAMIFILLLIYIIRTYIHIQMEKHAIHDHESLLFNKKYFLAELKTTCSWSARHDYPLSMLCISIDQFEKENKTYTNRIKRNTLKILGILIHALVRDGDIPCRYDENHLFILLPFTEKENALFLEERIGAALEKDNWIRSKNIVCQFKTTEFDKSESEEAFILRALT